MRRLLPALCALTLVLAACGRPDIRVTAVEPEEGAFVSQVVDFEGDAGPGLHITTDADGNPHMTYLALPEEGQEPPTDPLAPTLPAVMHAHHVDNIWTRTAVADDQADLTAEDTTSIVVDAEGTHHVAWTSGGALYYSDDPSGEAEPQQVTDTATAPQVAADEDGTPWIAFWEELTEAEGPTALLRLATPSGQDGWDVETVAEGEPFDPISVGLGITPDGPIVAYGSGGATQVATPRANDAWQSETVDEAGGGGVAMDVDADGNPHLSYLAPGGTVMHAHSIDGSPWEISQVGSGASGSPTGIALDDQGVHHVVWEIDGGIGYASNAEGEFAEEELPTSTEGGARPGVAAGTEGALYVAWHDVEGTELQLLTRSEDEPLLAVPSPTGAPAGDGGAPAACQPEGSELQIAAPPGAAVDGFDKDCLATVVGEPATLEFLNDDPGVPHNVSIYESEQASQEFLVGDTITGPEAITYDVEPITEEGNLFFRCDVHPTTMTGTFVVAAGGGGGGGGGGGS